VDGLPKVFARAEHITNQQKGHGQILMGLGAGGLQGEGLAVGLNRGQDGPLSTVSSLAGKLASAGAAVAIGAGSMPAMAFDSRTPISAAGGQPVVYQGDTVQIIIQPAPGMDEQAIARAVAAELDRRDRMKASRKRSNLADWD
jgi:hypothetical protein